MSSAKFTKSLIVSLVVSAVSLLGISSIASATPTSITGVTISGPVNLGGVLTASPTTPNNPTSIQWYGCTIATVAAASGVTAELAADGCTSIGSATNLSYTLASSNFGKFITVTATDSVDGTASGGGTTVIATSVWFGTPTFNGSGVTLSASDTHVGTVATAVGTSVFTGSALIASYQWYDCSAQVVAASTTLPSSPVTCSSINGATSSTYTFSGSDANAWVLYSITATNVIGSVTEYSPSTTTAVVATAPSNSSSPVLSAQTTYSISASAGSWNGTPAMISYTYQWYNCTAAVGAAAATLSSTCTAISGASTSTTSASNTYTFASGDVNKYVLVGVTASNGIAPNATQFSTTSTQIIASAPSVLSSATLTGTAAAGSLLTLHNATWGGFPIPTSFIYAWYGCISATTANAVAQSSATITTSGCTQISNSTTTLTLSTQAVVIGEVTATNATGSYSAFTAALPITQSAAPATSTDVSITGGSTTSGKFTASVTTDNWTGVPTPVLSYQWYDCTTQVVSAVHSGSSPSNFSSNCTAISGATLSTYNSVENDMAKFLLVAVTGTNATSTYIIYSASTASALADASPVNTGAPAITGTGIAGAAQTVTSGTWTTLPAPSYTYQWYVCNSAVVAANSVSSGCTTVASNGTGASYTPTVVDKATYTATYLMVAVTATSHAGTVTTYSAAGVALSTSPPSNAAAPTVPATPSTASPMTATSGNWQGAPTPSLSYQWYVCSQAVATSGVAVPSGCSYIAGATSASYTPSGQYAGSYFLVAVTGANGVNTGSGATSVTVYSSSTVTPLVSSVSINSLTISGSPSQGSTLTATISVTSYGTYSTTYQWYACVYSSSVSNAVPYGCTAISGATSSTFTLTSSQINSYVTVLASVVGTSTVTQTAQTTAVVTTNIPGVPTSVFATAGLASAVVTWTAPTTGAAVSSYTVSSSPAGYTCTSSSTTCTVSGLNAGTSYTFSVIASNSYGTSLASTASNAVTPSSTVPGAPTYVTAVAGNSSATVSWGAAAANGSPVTIYFVTSTPSGQSCSTSATSCVVTSLVNGTPYTFRVIATNLVGSGVASVGSNAVTPNTPVPNAPTNVVATAGNAKIVVTWTASTTSGSAVTGYSVQIAHTVGLSSVSTSCTTTTAKSCTFTKLINGTSYVITVLATSATGNSPSAPSITAMPVGPSTAPKIAKITALSAGFLLTIVAPTTTGGTPITKYQYSLNGGVSWSALSVTNIVSGLKHRLTYTVNVRTLNAAGFSVKSNAARVVTK